MNSLYKQQFCIKSYEQFIQVTVRIKSYEQFIRATVGIKSYEQFIQAVFLVCKYMQDPFAKGENIKFYS